MPVKAPAKKFISVPAANAGPEIDGILLWVSR